MHHVRRPNDSVLQFMNELSSRVVAESGRPIDRYHLGKILLHSLKDAPSFVSQIDGSTKESETNSSVMERSIRCAMSFQRIGLKVGDVMVLMAPNHLDMAIPFCAALYLGIIIAPVDRKLTVDELQNSFSVISPKLIFCQNEKVPYVKRALNELHLDSQIITFDDGGNSVHTFKDFLNQNPDDDQEIKSFKPADFDPEEAIALLVPTSGTTAQPKSVAVTYKNLAIAGPYSWSKFINFPTPTRLALVGSSLQWLTVIYHFILSPILRYTRLQSPMDGPDHINYLINTFKPTYIVMSPTLMTSLMKMGCELTCFESINLAGSAVTDALLTELKKLTPQTDVCNMYGVSEATGIGFHETSLPHGSSGTPLGCFQYRLVDINTRQDITEPNVQGELWMKGPATFKEYYNNPKATKEAFAEDRWFMTGDIFTRDENWNFFFVERYKLQLKYKHYPISPVELEKVISQHPGVLDVAVTGIPDPDCGDLPVACVVRRPLSKVTAQEIKDLVAGSLSETKELRGGVIFVDELPMTASTKLHRRKLKDMAMQMIRE